MKIQLYHFSLKKTVFFPIFLLFLQILYCADYFEEGKRLLLEDRPGEAVTAFFAASKESTVPPSINLYLGVSYLRLGKYNEALSYLSLGRKTDAVNSYLYSYNMGNIYFLQGRFDASEQAYNDTIAANGLYAPAFLNRANARIKLDKHEGALQDYKIYLNLEPETLQRPSIIKLISLLESAAEEAAKAKAFAEAQRAAEEAERAAEEKLKKYKAEEAAKAKALAEAQKAAEEAERKAAEERYKKLMDEVNSSLLSVDEADALSVGAEGTLDYTEENELD